MRILFCLFYILYTSAIYSQSNLIIYDLDTCQRDPSWVLPAYSGSSISTTRPEEIGCQIGCAIGCGVNNSCSINTSFLTKGWNTVSTDPLRYYEFTISTFPNVTTSLHYIYLNYRRSDTGPTSVSIYLNGSQVGILPISGTSCSSFGMGINQNYTGDMNFRIRFWGASQPEGTIRIDNVRVTNWFTTLPVELLNFSGESMDGIIKLNWQTASESGSSHFDVQRSLDVDNWETIGQIESVGDSQSLIEYNFWDRIVPNKDLIYYRLKQVDLNGDFKYSNIIAMQRKIGLISVRGDSIYYYGENPQEVQIWDIWGRFIGNLSGGQRQLEMGIYLVSIGGKVQKIMIN